MCTVHENYLLSAFSMLTYDTFTGSIRMNLEYYLLFKIQLRTVISKRIKISICMIGVHLKVLCFTVVLHW